ncbi:NAD(P)-binding protein [Nannocystis pusilla]|uniref:NAD(P)-binding protein n=1 Tax=Nannocystis pusilla TaxID=889268 RepID=A0ABS7TS53_9BACT|nr:NAD(P)-binding protein [Nannocystis pusilla]MBZ5710996.1 NAD(P)-binding protein [Nannocystis pusilla]
MTEPDPNNPSNFWTLTKEERAKIDALTPATAAEVTVTVLGGGIAGLTAAHELIRRGFKVRVIERSVGVVHQPATTSNAALDGLANVDLGGVARSQWATVPIDTNRSGPERKATGSLSGLGEYTLVNDRPDEQPDFIYGGKNSDDFIAIRFDANNTISDGDDTRLSKWMLSRPSLQTPKTALQVVVLSYEDRRDPMPSCGTPEEQVWGPQAARARAEALDPLLKSFAVRWLPSTLVTVPIDKKTYTDTGELTRGFPGVLLRVHRSTHLLPGEHGFRFFPGFYWHLRDTMARTPVYDFSQAEPVRTHRSVHDNLNEVEWQIMADPTRSFPTAFRRKPPSSLEEFIEQWQTLRNDLGFRESDMLRFMLRLGRFAASARARRREQYARMSWWDFVSLRDLDDAPLHTDRRGGFGAKDEPGDADRSEDSRTESAAEADGGDFLKKDRETWDEWKPKNEDSWDERERFFHDSFLADLDEQLKLDSSKRLPYGLRFRRALRHSPRALVAMDGLVTDAHTQGMLAIQLAMDQLGLNSMTDSTLNGPTSEAWFRHWHRYLVDEGVDFIAGEVTSIDIATGRYEYVQLGGEPVKEAPTVHYTICALDPVNVARLLKGEPEEEPEEEPKETRSITGRLGVLVNTTLTQQDPAKPPSELKKLFVDTWKRILASSDERVIKIRQRLLMDPSYRNPRQLWNSRMLADDKSKNFCQKYRDWAYDRRRTAAANNFTTSTDPQHLPPPSDMDPLGSIRGADRLDARFQVLSGIQLFFRRPTAFEQGHIYFAESPWGLMGMSQLQHWRNWNAKDTGIRGNLSLVYGSWRPENLGLGDFVIRRLIVDAQKAHPFGSERQPETKRAPWPSPGELTCEQLAERTREQVAWCRGTDAQFREDLHIPEITYYHMDDCIQYRGSGGGKARWNLCPYLINLRGDWDNRPPGEPWNPNRRDGRLAPPIRSQGYRVYGSDRPLVFAGAHTRTFTRMATMEAANESARHAVNSVLCHLSMRREAAESIVMSARIESEFKPPASAGRDPIEAEDPEDTLRDEAHMLKALSGQVNRVRGSFPTRWSSPSGSSGRPRTRPSDLPILQSSWFGDYCEVRDHEDYEIPFLDFFRKIDEELYGASGRPRRDSAQGEAADPYPADDHRVRRRTRARRPHLFDLLKLDALPDRIDDGEFSVEDTLRTLYSLGGVLLQAIRGPEPVKSVLNLIDSFDALFVNRRKSS